jgi:Fe-S-cluster-containing dehydrogenase component
MEKYLYCIPNRCTGCNRCAYVCSMAKEGMFIPSKARLHIANFAQDGYSVPNICFHCKNADCMAACPCGAIVRNERDIVVIDSRKCDGCGDCVDACPYGMIQQYASKVAYKCDLCGGNPACVDECQFGALVFKQPDKIVRKLRGEQMKQRQSQGTPEEKRRGVAEALLKSAVRVPRTLHYMGVEAPEAEASS